jgi:hypothetical protein
LSVDVYHKTCLRTLFYIINTNRFKGLHKLLLSVELLEVTLWELVEVLPELDHGVNITAVLLHNHSMLLILCCEVDLTRTSELDNLIVRIDLDWLWLNCWRGRFPLGWRLLDLKCVRGKKLLLHRL